MTSETSHGRISQLISKYTSTNLSTVLGGVPMLSVACLTLLEDSWLELCNHTVGNPLL